MPSLTMVTAACMPCTYINHRGVHEIQGLKSLLQTDFNMTKKKKTLRNLKDPCIVKTVIIGREKKVS